MRPLAKTTKSTSVNTRSCSQNASTLSMIAINRDVNDQPVHPSGSWIGPGKLDVSFAPLATLSLHPAIDDRTELSGRIKLNCPSATLPISTQCRDSRRETVCTQVRVHLTCYSHISIPLEDGLTGLQFLRNYFFRLRCRMAICLSISMPLASRCSKSGRC